LQRSLARVDTAWPRYDADVIPQHEYFAPLEAALNQLTACRRADVVRYLA
jgi:hypothetical protein